MYEDIWSAKYLWAVIKADGTFAGVPCTSYEEARELSAQHDGSRIFELVGEEDGCEESGYEDWGRIDDECGYDPYLGCYTDDC